MLQLSCTILSGQETPHTNVGDFGEAAPMIPTDGVVVVDSIAVSLLLLVM